MSSILKQRIIGTAATALLAIACAGLAAFGTSAQLAQASGADSSVTPQEGSLVAIHQNAGVSFDSEMDITEENCMTCHPDYVEQTATYNMYYNPHSDRAGIHFPNLECTLCHSMTETQTNWCTTCHNGLLLSEGWQALPLLGGRQGA